MREGWETRKLKDVCILITDGVHNSPQYEDDGIPMLDSKHIGEDFKIDDSKPTKFISSETDKILSKRCKPQENDILISSRGSIGKIAIVQKGQNFNIMGNIILIRSPRNINVKFLAYSFLAYVKDLEKLSRGVAQKGLYLNQVRNFQLSYPSLEEQKQIVAILDEVFAAIDQAKANVEKNLQNAKELFQSKLNEIFSQKSEGWEEKKFGNGSLLKIIDGDRGKNYPKKSDFFSEGHCVFMSTRNVRPTGFDFSEVVFITEERDHLLKKGKLQRDDVVMTTRGTIGNLGWYNSEVPYDHIRINSGMLIFRVNKQKILPEYLFTVLRSSVVKKQISDMTSGAAQPQLPIKTLVNFDIPIHSNLNEQKRMVAKVHDMERLQNKLYHVYTKKIRSLEELKKSILQKAFAGELISASKELTV